MGPWLTPDVGTLVQAQRCESVLTKDEEVMTEAVITTIVWSAVVSFIAYKVVDLVLGLRVSEEDERMGLDISSHGESAYNR